MSHMEYSFIFCPFSTKIRLQLYVTTFQFYVIPKNQTPLALKGTHTKWLNQGKYQYIRMVDLQIFIFWTSV